MRLHPQVAWSSSWSGLLSFPRFHAARSGWKTIAWSSLVVGFSVFSFTSDSFRNKNWDQKVKKKNNNWDQNHPGSVDHLWITNVVFLSWWLLFLPTQTEAIQASLFLILVSVFLYSADLVWLCIFINITIIIIVLSCLSWSCFISDLHDLICLVCFSLSL